jgi:cobalt-zinc-cadmium resistance protein CzcA
VIDRLIRFSLSQRAVVLLLCAGFVAWGVFAFRRLPIEAFPDVTDPMVQIITLFPGRAAEEVERQVTLPLEKELNGLPGLFRLRSVSIFGLSFITLTFDDNIDDYFARQQVAERLRQVDLPDGVEPALGPLYTPIGEIYRYTLEGADHSPMDLRTIQEWTVERQLRQVPGVVDVVSYGGYQKEIHVDVDLARLRALDLTLNQVAEALSRSNANAGGNYIEHGEQEFVVRGLGTLRGVDDIKTVLVTTRKGTPVTIADLASVTVGEVPRRGAVTRQSSPRVCANATLTPLGCVLSNNDAVEGIVLMRKKANPSEVLALLREKIAHLNHEVLPHGVHLAPFYDRTDLVHTTLHTVGENLAIGAGLVFVILLIFLLDLRGALIVAAVIPLALLASFVYLDWRKMSANLLSMGAVDFGIIVDGAVVVVENIFARLAHERPTDPQRRRDVILRATIEVGRPTLFSLLVIIVAYVPIFALERVEGRIFAPMANTVASALVGALVFSLTLIPLLAMLMLRRPVRERESPAVAGFRRVYEPALAWVMRHRMATITASAAALFGAVVLLANLGTEFLPELNEGSFYVHVTLPNGVSLTEGQRLAPRLTGIFLDFPEVRQVMTQLGRPEDGTDPKLTNNLEYFVDLLPPADWRKGLSRETLVAQMSRRLQAVPGIEFSFSQPIKDNVEENIAGVFGQVSVKIFGEDLNLLADKAEEVKRVLAGVPGVADLGIFQSGDLPQLQISIDRKTAARYGINVADVQTVVETAIGGKITTWLWEGERKFGVTLRLGEAWRGNVASIRDIPVSTPEGGRVPLKALADIRLSSGRAAINREANSRFAAVKLNVRGRDLGGFVADARQRVSKAVHLPEGYYTVWGGEFENQQRAMRRLAIVIPLSIALIFLLLFWTFGSLRSALLILIDVPFALIGGVVGLWVARLNLSVAACVGFIALMGQAVLNGVLVVAAIDRERARGTPLEQACIRGTQARLRAVLMTALLAALGLLPAALSHAIGSETQRPLAVVVIGGLVSATLLTLLVLPVLYLLFSPRAVEAATPSAPTPTPNVTHAAV